MRACAIDGDGQSITECCLVLRTLGRGLGGAAAAAGDVASPPCGVCGVCAAAGVEGVEGFREAPTTPPPPLSSGFVAPLSPAPFFPSPPPPPPRGAYFPVHHGLYEPYAVLPVAHRSPSARMTRTAIAT